MAVPPPVALGTRVLPVVWNTKLPIGREAVRVIDAGVTEKLPLAGPVDKPFVVPKAGVIVTSLNGSACDTSTITGRELEVPFPEYGITISAVVGGFVGMTT